MSQPVWMGFPLGARVTIRRRLPEGGYADTVGTLERAEPGYVEVRHRSGRLRRVEAASIAIAHLIKSPSRAL
ncbi:MAG: hypothetical protein LBG60_05130 [Bifidobacteriaceae bacterium]|nr:hypothetical protein [Bifidobacteriaceae bacterium]